MDSLKKLSKSELIEIIIDLRSEVDSLKNQLNKDSSNSSKPPSSDAPWDRSKRKHKQRFNFQRKPGGQKGHIGTNLSKFDLVDHIVEYTINSCPNCSSNSLELIDYKTRQVVDIPPIKMDVKEHKFYQYNCKCCGTKCIDSKINQYPLPVQYGVRVKSLVSYLNVHQLIPYKRLVELIENVFNHKISQGSISNFTKEISGHLGEFIGELKQSFVGRDQIIHSDETGIIVDGKLNWVHVYSNSRKTYLEVHEKRGCEAIDEIGILPNMQGTLIHDRFGPYFQYENVIHGLCNAHILRNIKAAQELDYKPWLNEIKNLLIRSHKAKNKNRLKKNSAKFLMNKYENILRKERKYYQKMENQLNIGKGHRSLDHKLFIALWKHRHKILYYLKKPDVPFDNNQAERDLRMLKVKVKVSNIFKSNQWAQIHLNIRSFISTLKKNKLNILDGLNQIQQNNKFANHIAV